MRGHSARSDEIKISEFLAKYSSFHHPNNSRQKTIRDFSLLITTMSFRLNKEQKRENENSMSAIKWRAMDDYGGLSQLVPILKLKLRACRLNFSLWHHWSRTRSLQQCWSVSAMLERGGLRCGWRRPKYA